VGQGQGRGQEGRDHEVWNGPQVAEEAYRERELGGSRKIVYGWAMDGCVREKGCST